MVYRENYIRNVTAISDLKSSYIILWKLGNISFTMIVTLMWDKKQSQRHCSIIIPSEARFLLGVPFNVYGLQKIAFEYRISTGFLDSSTYFFIALLPPDEQATAAT